MLRHQTLVLPFSYAVIIRNANWMEFVQGMYIGELGILSHVSFQIRMLLDIDINCYSILISTRYYLLHTTKRCFSGIWKMCQNADFSMSMFTLQIKLAVSCLCSFEISVTHVHIHMYKHLSWGYHNPFMMVHWMLPVSRIQRKSGQAS